MLVPMIVARSGAERGNHEWLEKLQCSSGVLIQKRSAPLRRNCLIVARSGAEMANIEWLEKVVFPFKSVPLRSVGTGKCSSACTNDCGMERSGAGKY